MSEPVDADHGLADSDLPTQPDAFLVRWQKKALLARFDKFKDELAGRDRTIRELQMRVRAMQSGVAAVDAAWGQLETDLTAAAAALPELDAVAWRDGGDADTVLAEIVRPATTHAKKALQHADGNDNDNDNDNDDASSAGAQYDDEEDAAEREQRLIQRSVQRIEAAAAERSEWSRKLAARIAKATGLAGKSTASGSAGQPMSLGKLAAAHKESVAVRDVLRAELARYAEERDQARNEVVDMRVELLRTLKHARRGTLGKDAKADNANAPKDTDAAKGSGGDADGKDANGSAPMATDNAAAAATDGAAAGTGTGTGGAGAAAAALGDAAGADKADHKPGTSALTDEQRAVLELEIKEAQQLAADRLKELEQVQLVVQDRGARIDALQQEVQQGFSEERVKESPMYLAMHRGYALKTEEAHQLRVCVAALQKELALADTQHRAGVADVEAAMQAQVASVMARLTEAEQVATSLRAENARLQQQASAAGVGGGGGGGSAAADGGKKTVLEEYKALNASLQDAASKYRGETVPRWRQEVDKVHAAAAASGGDAAAALTEENGAMLEEIEEMSKMLGELQEQNSSLAAAAAAQEATAQQLAEAKSRLDRVGKLNAEEKQRLEAKVFSLESRLQSNISVVASAETRLEKAEATIRARDAQLVEAKAELSKVEGELSKQGVELHALQMDKESSGGDKKKDKGGKQRGGMAEIDELQAKLRRAVEERDQNKRKYESVRNSIMDPMGSADDLREQVDMYRRLLRCPCCNTREKDTIISNCWHVFCRECVDERFESRNRKCPGCSRRISKDEVHNLYL